MLSSAFGSPDLVRTLLDAGADVKARDVRGMTPLMFAVSCATAPGSVASDNVSCRKMGCSRRSCWESTHAPGLGLDEVFNYVRARVDQVRGGKQLPWAHSSVVGRYQLRAGTEAPAAGVSAPPPPVTGAAG